MFIHDEDNLHQPPMTLLQQRCLYCFPISPSARANISLCRPSQHKLLQSQLLILYSTLIFYFSPNQAISTQDDFHRMQIENQENFRNKNFLSFINKKATNQDTKETTNQKICYNLCCNLTMFHQMSSLTKNIKPEKTTPASRYSKHTTDANHTTTRWQALWYMSLHLPLHWKKATHQYSEDHYFDVHKAHFQQTKIS